MTGGGVTTTGGVIIAFNNRVKCTATASIESNENPEGAVGAYARAALHALMARFRSFTKSEVDKLIVTPH